MNLSLSHSSNVDKVIIKGYQALTCQASCGRCYESIVIIGNSSSGIIHDCEVLLWQGGCVLSDHQIGAFF